MHFVEFFNSSFLAANYITSKPSPALADVVEFFWQTQYSHHDQFSVTTFPRNGSSLLFNLASPFKIEKENRKVEVSKTAYYLRNTPITSFHRSDNLIFGVQFLVNLPLLSGIVREHLSAPKAISGIFSSFVDELKQRDSFSARVILTEGMLMNLVSEKLLRKARLVNTIIDHYTADLSQLPKAGDLSNFVFASSKTIERYFIDCLATSPRQALKSIRIRNALSAYLNNKTRFNYCEFGYYDESHFYKDLRNMKVSRYQIRH